MKKTFSSKKSAFSLIELSIVLIIIGLLIAGITGGASLIKSSELRSVMGEARGYAVAVNAFYTQFNALPGDFDKALGGTPCAGGCGTGSTTDATGNFYGDGDGQIKFCVSCSTTAGTLTGSEGALAWHHLSAIGAVDLASDYTFKSNGVASHSPGTNFPSSKIKSSGWMFDYNTTSSQNIVVLTGSTSSTAGTATNTVVNGTQISSAAILPTDALSIDSKIDDGSANTGKIMGVLSGCNSGAAYTVATGTKACALSYQVDVNS